MKTDPICPDSCGTGNTTEGLHYRECPWYEQEPCSIHECHGAGHWKVRARLLEDVQADLLLCHVHYSMVRVPSRPGDYSIARSVRGPSPTLMIFDEWADLPRPSLADEVRMGLHDEPHP